MRLLQVLLVLIILGLQVRLWVGSGSLTEINHLNDSIDQQSAENAQLESRNNALLLEVDSLKTTTDAIEEIAREDLGLIKDGETYYMIVDPAENESSDEGKNPITRPIGTDQRE